VERIGKSDVRGRLLDIKVGADLETVQSKKMVSMLGRVTG
jgi:hypothetical protein